MKTTIYWTKKQFSDKFFENHVDYQKFCVVAIADKKDFAVPMTVSETNIHKSFNTEEDAIFFINELNKPVYYKHCGSSYELIYVENDSEDWYNIFDKWSKTYKIGAELKKIEKMNFFERIFYKLKGMLFKTSLS